MIIQVQPKGFASDPCSIFIREPDHDNDAIWGGLGSFGARVAKSKAAVAGE
jgi:hypothetical protein